MTITGTAFSQADGEKVPKLKKIFLFNNGGSQHVHSTLEQGTEIVEAWAAGDNIDNHEFEIFATESPSGVTAQNLAGVDVMVFNNTTGMGVTLNETQQGVFQDAVEQDGIGFHGWHGTTDIWWEPTWPWWVEWTGCRYRGSADWNPTTIYKMDEIATEHWPEEFDMIAEEWYQFDPNPADNPNNVILLELEPGPINPSPDVTSLPYSWVNESKAGKFFLTGFGHKAEILDREDINEHLYRGLIYAAGGYDIAGCMDENASNYREEATIQGDVECITDPIGVELDYRNTTPGVEIKPGSRAISVNFMEQGPHTLSVTDVSGVTLFNEKNSGQKSYHYDGLDKSGIYFLNITTEHGQVVRRINLF